MQTCICVCRNDPESAGARKEKENRRREEEKEHTGNKLSGNPLEEKMECDHKVRRKE